jgi:hypothetical protein
MEASLDLLIGPALTVYLRRNAEKNEIDEPWQWDEWCKMLYSVQLGAIPEIERSQVLQCRQMPTENVQRFLARVLPLCALCDPPMVDKEINGFLRKSLLPAFNEPLDSVTTHTVKQMEQYLLIFEHNILQRQPNFYSQPEVKNKRKSQEIAQICQIVQGNETQIEENEDIDFNKRTYDNANRLEYKDYTNECNALNYQRNGNYNNNNRRNSQQNQGNQNNNRNRENSSIQRSENNDETSKKTQKPLEEVTCTRCNRKGHYANRCDMELRKSISDSLSEEFAKFNLMIDKLTSKLDALVPSQTTPAVTSQSQNQNFQ